MKTIDDGGPAFPHAVQAMQSSYSVPISGMSLRAWLAGQALAGMDASQNDANYAAEWAVEVADATIAELNKQK